MIDTRKADGGIRRIRKCKVCGRRRASMEQFEGIASKPEIPKAKLAPKPKAPPKPKALPKPKAAAPQRTKMEVRRAIEDREVNRALRVPSYYIEDDEDSSAW